MIILKKTNLLLMLIGLISVQQIFPRKTITRAKKSSHKKNVPVADNVLNFIKNNDITEINSHEYRINIGSSGISDLPALNPIASPTELHAIFMQLILNNCTKTFTTQWNKLQSAERKQLAGLQATAGNGATQTKLTLASFTNMLNIPSASKAIFLQALNAP